MQQLKQGFTLVELALSIFFLALLSLTVALVISNISNIYNKGLAIKSVNSTGSDLIEELSLGVSSAPATELTAICAGVYTYSARSDSAYVKCVADSAYKFIFSEQVANIRNIDSTEYKTLQTSGVFCTGKYSYIWNTGYIDNSLYEASPDSLGAAVVTYNISNGAGGYTTKNIGSTEGRPFRLLRFEDPSRVACASQLDAYGSGLSGNTYNSDSANHLSYDLTHDATGSDYVIASEPIELIHADNNEGLAIYELYIARPSQDSTTHRLFYSGSFTLATLRGGVDLTATSDYCHLQGFTEDGRTDDFNYCAINKFNFAAQATGK